jgi:hypothetical protein
MSRPDHPDGPRPAQPSTAHAGELGRKLERIVREQRPPTFQGKGRVVAIVFAIALGGLVVSWLTGGSASPLGQAVRDRYENQPQPPPVPPEERPLPKGTGLVAAPGPEAPPPVAQTPPSTEAVITVPSAHELALAAQRAGPADRAALRALALEALQVMAAQAAHRRTALAAAARLAGEAMPEEAERWQALVLQAAAAIEVPEQAGIGVLFLAATFDRGGELGQRALESVVEDERRPLELRVAAARALPAARRGPLASRIGSRRDAHPSLLSALR